MRALMLSALLLVAPIAAAQSIDRLAQIREQQAVLLTELDTGVLKLTPREGALVRKDHARVAAILAANATLDDLGVAERVELDNALERINALVVATRQAEEDADVCHYERKTGTKLPKLDCATASQRRNSRDGARAYMEKPRICVPPGCGQ